MNRRKTAFGPAGARGAENVIAAVTIRRTCARRLIVQPSAMTARVEFAQSARIQEMPGFKGFL
jgi:hypothetical protein